MFLLVSLACVDTEVAPGDLPVEIQPIPDAQTVVARMYGGDAGSQYTMTVDHTPEDVTRAVEAKLNPQQWHKREFDHLNPDIPTAHVRGWQRFFDETKGAWIHQWSAEWENDRGEIVSYDLAYSTEGSATEELHRAGRSRIQVYANYYSRETATRDSSEAQKRAEGGT